MTQFPFVAICLSPLVFLGTLSIFDFAIGKKGEQRESDN